MYRFGSRDITDVTFKAKTAMSLGALSLKAMQPALHMDSATASTLEQATTTVYAQGGKGNTRLITWEGEKTLTFTVTDALLSPVGIAILTGAKLLGEGTDQDGGNVHVHTTATAAFAKNDAGTAYEVIIYNSFVDKTSPIFIMDYTNDVIGKMICTEKNVTITHKTKNADDANSYNGTIISIPTTSLDDGVKNKQITSIFIDYYEIHTAASVSEIQIDQECFAGNFYVEAETFFRNTDGKDLPAVITIPNAKIQSNMSISMSATGDPSTFDFVMEAMPGYTIFDKSKKVMCVIQTINESSADKELNIVKSVMTHTGDNPKITGGVDSGSNEEFQDSVTVNNDTDNKDFTVVG